MGATGAGGRGLLCPPRDPTGMGHVSVTNFQAVFVGLRKAEHACGYGGESMGVVTGVRLSLCLHGARVAFVDVSLRRCRRNVKIY